MANIWENFHEKRSKLMLLKLLITLESHFLGWRSSLTT